MSSRYKVYDHFIPHFVTITVVDWIDALSRPDYKDLIVESLKYCIANKGLLLHCWVIMNNHMHLVLSAAEGAEIPGIMRDFKKYTSKQLIERIRENPSESRKEWMLNMFSYAGKYKSGNEQYQFWQQDYHPIALMNEGILKQRMNYVHENPVRAGIVYEARQYKYSSAADYYDLRPGMIPLVLLY